MTAMPPVLPEREECERVLSDDPDLEGYSPHTYVFIDTTLGLHERVGYITLALVHSSLFNFFEDRSFLLQCHCCSNH